MNLSYVGIDRTGGKKVDSNVFFLFPSSRKKNGLEVEYYENKKLREVDFFSYHAVCFVSIDSTSSPTPSEFKNKWRTTG